MTTTAELLIEAYGRISDGTREALDGLGHDLLLWRADDDANTIAWLAWHLLRVQDDHLSNATGQPQVWLAERWAERFGMTLAVSSDFQ
ncbi:MAG TPA: DinB family protein [Acidimicrobiales bacterium]